MNKHHKRLLKAGIITLVLTGLYTWGIPAAVNLPARKDFIQNKIKQASGYIVDIGNPKMSMGVFPSVWISSDSIEVLNEDNSKALWLQNPKLRISLLPLLLKRVVISHVSAQKEEVYFTFSKDRQFLLGQYPIKFNKNGDFKLSKIDWNFGEYDFNLDDKFNNKKVKLSGKYISKGVYIANKQAQFATDGFLKVGDKSEDFSIDLNVKLPINQFSKDKFRINSKIDKFDLSLISDYVDFLTGGLIKKTSGTISLNAQTLKTSNFQKHIIIDLKAKNLLVQGKDEVSKIVSKNPLSFTLDFKTRDNGFELIDTKLEGENIHASARGNIIEKGNHFPYFENFEIKVGKSRLEDLCLLLPWSKDLVSDMDFYAIKKHILHGEGEGQVKLNGLGGLNHYPKLVGNVRLSDAYIPRRIKGTTKGADVKLDMHGHNMDVDVYVPATNNQWVSVKGVAKIDGSKYSELKIKSSENVVLETAYDTLMAVHEGLKFKIGPLPLMTIKGVGNVDVYSAGKKVDPHIFGEFKFKNATASFNRIHNMVLTNGSGEVLFQNTKIPFKTYSAYLNNLPVEIKGECGVLGQMNVITSAKKQNINDILKVINTSDDLKEVQRVIKPFKNTSGVADLFLNIYGVAKDAESVKFNEDVFAKGKVTFYDSQTTLQETYLPLKKINGVVNFDKQNSDYDVTGYLKDSKIHVTGTGTQKSLDLTASSNKIALIDCFDMFQPKLKMPFKEDIGKLNASFVAKYNGAVQEGHIDYDKINVEGKLLQNTNTKDFIRTKGGNFSISKGLLNVPSLSGFFNETPFNLSFTGNNIYKMMHLVDAKFNFKDFQLSRLNGIASQLDISQEIKNQVKLISDLNGAIDITGNVKDGKINADTDLKNVSFTYKPYDATVKVISGMAKMRNNVMYLDKINSNISSMPVLIDGSITDPAGNNPYLKLYVNAKPNQAFFDRFINSKFVYPVKMKGDVNLSASLNGNLNHIKTHSVLDIKENSYIYYMGATLSGVSNGNVSTEGMTTNPVSLVLDGVVSPNKIYLNSLDYNQIITSQNKKQFVQKQLGVSGEISMLKDNVLKFNNLRVKTAEPTNAKIFNILLKKPTVKQGVFTSDLLINGTSLAPYTLGTLNISSVDIPLLDATIKDIDIDFQKDYVYLKSKGIILTNDILLDAKIVNKSALPYIVDDLNVRMDVLDLNIITSKFNDFDADNVRTKKSETTSDILPVLNQIILKNAVVNADKIIIKNAQATDFSSHITINDQGLFDVDKYVFNLANGVIEGSVKYDIKNSLLDANADIKNADAKIIAEAFFDMSDQVYGDVTGKMNVKCSGTSSFECLNTLSGGGDFNINNGRMPKLGSLEYLLKAGNLLSGGLTAVSINGIIDLITPLKTGNFDSIKGHVDVKNGVADNIEVYSSGKDLNMYLTGNYNFTNLVADMEVYGSLSKDFSTVLGKISNASLNRLLNRIPGVSINSINPESTSNIYKIPNFNKESVLRVFKADIFGDINGTNYVKSFKWIKN